MTSYRTRWCCLAVAVAIAMLTDFGVLAQSAGPNRITLHVAAVEPRGAGWSRAFDEWDRMLRRETNGRLGLTLERRPAGDERAIIDRLRAHRIDGASLTELGIAQVAPRAMVLRAPDLFDEHASLDRARSRMDRPLRAAFAASGLLLVGWSDYGRTRVFSSRPIAHPADLRATRPWVWAPDGISPAVLEIIGTTRTVRPERSLRGEVLAGRVSTVMAPASVVAQLLQGTRFAHVTEDPRGIVLGAIVFDSHRVASLAPELRAALVSTGESARASLQHAAIADDDVSYAALVSAGTQPVPTDAHRTAWQVLAHSARAHLVGQLYSQHQLDTASVLTSPGVLPVPE
ncbi:MAG: TRAP transporter substrate-binding protein DctP [Myxococcota bacterium]|nr:TRAP transporter substrate-binding protein DctP [Myxococcota bacterium]